MIVKDIIYKNLLQLLKALTVDGKDFERYYNAKNLKDQDQLIKISDVVLGTISDLKKARTKGVIFTAFDSLYPALDELNTKFNDYPNHRTIEIKLLLKLIEKLNSAIGGLPLDIRTKQINTTQLSLVPLKKKIAHRNFFHKEALVQNCLFLIDLTDQDSLFKFIDDTLLSLEIICITLSKIGNATFNMPPTQYI